MRIGVSGAGGHLGREVIAELLERCGYHDVVGISRSPKTVQEPAEGRSGDYDNPSTLLAAYRGLDRLLLIPSGDMGNGVRGRQFVDAIDAALEAGVQHIVMMSTAGLRQQLEPSLDAAFWAGERHLVKTAPRWTIVRMSCFIESILPEVQTSLQTLSLTGLGDERVAFVARNDVAAMAAGVLVGSGHIGAIYHATGPAAVSGEERAAIVSGIVGKPIRFEPLDEQQLRAELIRSGFPEPYVDATIDMKRKFVRGAFDIVTGDVARLAGAAPRSLGEMLPRLLTMRSRPAADAS